MAVGRRSLLRRWRSRAGSAARAAGPPPEGRQPRRPGGHWSVARAAAVRPAGVRAARPRGRRRPRRTRAVAVPSGPQGPSPGLGRPADRPLASAGGRAAGPGHRGPHAGGGRGGRGRGRRCGRPGAGGAASEGTAADRPPRRSPARPRPPRPGPRLRDQGRAGPGDEERGRGSRAATATLPTAAEPGRCRAMGGGCSCGHRPPAARGQRRPREAAAPTGPLGRCSTARPLEQQHTPGPTPCSEPQPRGRARPGACRPLTTAAPRARPKRAAPQPTAGPRRHCSGPPPRTRTGRGRGSTTAAPPAGAATRPARCDCPGP